MNASVKNTNAFYFLTGIFLICLSLAVYYQLYFLLALPFTALFFYLGWMQFSSVFFLLIFLLPWSAEYNFSPTLGTDLPDEPLMLLVSFLAIAHAVYIRDEKQQSVWKHPLTYLLFTHFGWMLACTVLSSEIFISVKYLLAKSWYIIAFFYGGYIVFSNKKNIKNASIIFTFSLVAVTLVIFIHHASEGFLFKNINNAVVPFFRNHVNYSAMLVCVVPLLVAFRKLSTNKSQRLVLLIIFLFVTTALILAFSRGAWLAFFLGIITPFIIKRKWLVPSYLLLLSLIFFSVQYLRSNDRYIQFAPDFEKTIYHTDFREHLFATYEGKDVSTAERFYRWIAGVRMVEEKPFTGFGPSTFSRNYRQYTVPLYKTWVSDNKDASTVHNYFLLTATEQGLPGLFIFVLLTVAVLLFVQRLYHQTIDAFYKQVLLATGSVFVMILTVNFLSDLIETDKIGSLFFLCIGLLVAIDAQIKYQLAKEKLQSDHALPRT